MRLGALSLATLVSSFFFGCVDGRTHDPESQGGNAGATSGGNSSQGGATNTSGGASSGGALMSGGGPNTSGGAASGGSSNGGSAGTAGSAGSAGNAGGGGASGGTNSGGSGGMNKGGSSSAGGNAGSNSGGNAGKGGGTSSGGTSSGGQGQGGGTSVQQPPPINGGSQGWASRYWDCCKPACGWSGNVRSGQPMKSCSQQNQVLSDNNAKNACESGGSAFMCWSGVPWSVSDTLALGFAAASGGNYVCGRCYQIQFNGQGHSGSPASPQLNGKTMIVQVINNGGVQADQFDILIPGGGVGALNACNTQWGTSDLGAQYGGFLAGCNGSKSCVQQKCQSVFAGKPDLLAGCDWFLNWFGAADNPSFVFKQIACPAAITQKSGLSDPG